MHAPTPQHPHAPSPVARPARPGGAHVLRVLAVSALCLGALPVAATAPAVAAPATPAAPVGGAASDAEAARVATGCTGTAYLYGVRQDGTLTFAAIDGATNVRTRKSTGPKLPWPVRAMAPLDHRTILVATTAGALYRIDVTGNDRTLTIAKPVAMAHSGWAVAHLAADGAGHLFATLGTNRQLFRWDILAKKPSGGQINNKIRVGSGFHLKAMTAMGGSQLMGVSSAGRLMGYRVVGENRYTTATLASSGWGGVSAVASPGGGLFYARTAGSGALSTRKDANVADGSGADIALVGTVSSSGWTQKLLSAAPRNVTCPGGLGITYQGLVTMFGSGWVGEKPLVEQGLPGLQAEMSKGSVTNAARKAAFLATLVSESAMRWNADQGGSYSYRGRGYIQLTNDFNYRDAGRYFGIDLLGQPDLAKSLQWSAPIARWYWTVARTTTNACADAHDMHCVNRNIGFAWNTEEATRRCDRFKSAYKYFTGAYPANTICYPARLPAPGSTSWHKGPHER